MQSLKSAGVGRCQSRSTGSKLSSRRSGQTTENNLQKMAACPESEEAIQRVLTRTKRRTVAVTTNRKWKLPITKSFCDSFIWQSFIYFVRLSQWLLYTLSRARFKEKGRDKKNKKVAFTVERIEVSVELSNTEDTDPRENNCRKIFVVSSAPSTTTFTPRESLWEKRSK